MRKILILLLVVTFISVVGCSKNNGNSGGAVLVAPDNITIVAGSGFLDISWSPVEGASGYVVIIKGNQEGLDYIEDYITVSTLFARKNGLSNNSNYYINVAAIKGESVGAFSDMQVASPTDDVSLPSKVTGVKAVEGDSEVTLSWIHVPDAESYTIFMAHGSDDYSEIYSLVGERHVVRNLKNGDVYKFKIVSVNKLGNGVNSDIITVTTKKPLTPPDAPAGFVAVVGDAKVLLSWSLSATAVNYSIYKSLYQNGTYDLVATVCGTNLEVGELINGQKYWFKIVARNVAGQSSFSAPVSATPITPIKLPDEVGNLSAIGSDGQVNISWTAPSNATSYKIYKSLDANGGYVLIGSTSSSTYTAVALDNGKTYWFKIIGVNGAGMGAASIVVATPKAPLRVPSTVTGVFAVAGNASVTIYWEPAAGAVNYSIFQNGVVVKVCDSSPCVITGLTNGTAYSFFVHGNNESGEGGHNNVITVTPVVPAEPPYPPTNFAALPMNAEVILNWDNVLGDIVYNVYQGLSADNISVKVGSVSVNNMTVANLTNGQTYWFFVTAQNSKGESVGSVIASATPFAPILPPTAPLNVVATAGNTYALISWENVSGADVYDIYQSSSPQGAWVDIGSSHSSPFTVYGLGNGFTYWFKVAGKNSAGYGVMSDTVSVMPIAPVVIPFVPQFTSVQAGDGYGDLGWSVSDTAQTYYLYQSDGADGNYAKIQTVNSNSLRVTPLTNGQTYYFKVSAANSAGESGLSSPFSVTPKAQTPTPLAPLGLTALAFDGYVELSWQSVHGADSYIVYKSLTQDGTYQEVLTTNSVSVAVQGLTNDTPYWFKVSATNVAGTGAFSEPVSVTPIGIILIPASPIITTLIAGDSKIYLAWDNVTWAEGYKIYISPNNENHYSFYNTSSDNGEFIEGLTNGVLYYLKVTAYNVSGESSLNDSLSASGTPKPPVIVPTNPIGLMAVADNASANLSWGASAGANFYNIYQSNSENGEYILVESVTGSPADTITGLANGVTYWFKVSAANIAGESGFSNTISVTPLAPIVRPLAPTSLTATPGDSRVTLTWAASTGATSYTIYQTDIDGNNATPSTPCDNLSITIVGLTNGTPYYFVVKGVNDAGESDNSIVASATPIAPIIPIPTNFTVTNGVASGSALLSWDKIDKAFADDYTVYMSSTGKDGVYGVIAIVYQPASGNVVSYTKSGLVKTRVYWFKVRTNKGGKASGFTESKSVTIK